MKSSVARFLLALTVTVALWSLTGCNDQSKAPANAQKTPGNHPEPQHAKDGHAEVGHAEGGHTEKEGEAHEKPLTTADVKLPESFSSGVGRLQELHGKIDQQIQAGDLAHVHRTAEEMALVAKKMKELARKELPEEKQTEAGRLCNEVAGDFSAIDEAADAGKKDETKKVHDKMGAAIEKLQSLTK